MLIIKDKAGKTVGTLKDEDNEPEVTEELKNKKRNLFNELKEGVESISEKRKQKEALDELTRLSQEMGLYKELEPEEKEKE